MPALPPLPRRRLLGMGGVGISSLVLPPAASATSVIEPTFDEDRRIPYLAATGSQEVDGVTVTATVNSADDGGSGRYLHLSRNKIATTFTFSPVRTSIQIRTSNHNDTPSGANNYPVGAFERYDLTWKLAGVVQDTVAITDIDTTTVYSVPGGFDTLEVTYTFSEVETPLTTNLDGKYGSFIEFWLV